MGARIQQCLRTGCGGSAGGDDVIHQQHPLPFHELRLLRPEGTGRICQTLVQRESCLMASGPDAAERLWQQREAQCMGQRLRHPFRHIVAAPTAGGRHRNDAVVSQVKSIMVPTTTEILWGVISGDILSTAWERLTSNTGALLGLGFQQIAKITGTPFSQIFDFIGSGATYIGYVSGQQVSLSTSIKYPVLAGGIAVCQETTGSVRNMVQLMPMKIDKVGAASVLSSKGERFEMADDTQVYLWYKGQYYYTKLTSVNSDDYYLTGWYDNFGCAAGKKVRIIVAVKKD